MHTLETTPRLYPDLTVPTQLLGKIAKTLGYANLSNRTFARYDLLVAVSTVSKIGTVKIYHNDAVNETSLSTPVLRYMLRSEQSP
ncbi:hypothetical protein VTP01DRAFT_4831 [Rhizomucor pusillus]|uniref:uncharacterized protein n=1 Tax=Rhizomucor pusillus TaxID=4840 RepID=UPI003742A63E